MCLIGYSCCRLDLPICLYCSCLFSAVYAAAGRLGHSTLCCSTALTLFTANLLLCYYAIFLPKTEDDVVFLLL